MTAQPCGTCNTLGHIRGLWHPEICPACNGSGEFPLAEVPDKDLQGCFLAIVVFGGLVFLAGCDWAWSRWVA